MLINGKKGQRFPLSRSVRQGCPFAPYLFLFFSEVMHMYLSSAEVQLTGIGIPPNGDPLIDTEFADDTSLYLHGDIDNLRKAEIALTTFCQGSGALINWHKSVGFWVSDEMVPPWTPDPGFRWIPKGTSVRYLGCQVGMEITPESQISPLLLLIKKKLLFWSTAKLSLAGRVVVVNYVLLSTLWYVLSSWCFSRSCLNQVQRLIRCFLWSGKKEGNIRSKVAWKTIILPISKGGLGVIDPQQQCQALLGKFIVRSLLPWAGPWSNFLHQRSIHFSPKIGGDWKDNVRWLFLTDSVARIPNTWENRFIRGICNAWTQMRKGLGSPSPLSFEERDRQPLIWNKWFKAVHGQMFGSRPKLDWASMANGPAKSFREWQNFLLEPESKQRELTMGIRGGWLMTEDLKTGNWGYEMAHMEAGVLWTGVMDGNRGLSLVRGHLGEGNFLFFHVQKRGKLHRLLNANIGFMPQQWEQVRIVAFAAKKWHLDPSPMDIAADWQLWAYGSVPLAQLTWDPGEFHWINPRTLQLGSDAIPFFQYSVKLGRLIQMHNSGSTTSNAHRRNREVISSDFL
mgnify:FL=1